jgi:23S rRNA (adenine2030-N6)-methyltransferase
VNYRHAFHAGNYADVLKHALLVRLMRSLQRKEKGLVFVDTHAGRGSYDLSAASEGGSRAREPEWPDGIGRLWERSDAPPPVAEYLEIVRAFDRSRGNLLPGPRFYPGSPRIARLCARPQDRLELWERHPAECAALREQFRGERRVSVHEADGYGAMRACLPPEERRAIVLVDPPFEVQGEWTSIADSLREGIGRFPGGTYAIWYPLTNRASPGGFAETLASAGVTALAVEMVTDPDAARMTGCGVLIVNPPWKFDQEARLILNYLGSVIYRCGGAQGSVRWIVSKLGRS